MKYLYSVLIGLLFFIGCKSTQQYNNTLSDETNWVNIGVTDDFDIYVDTASIVQKDGRFFAREKKVYTTVEGRKSYVDKIRSRYEKMGNSKKAEKWNDFSYYIYYSEYDCVNKRLRVLTVEDFDSSDRRIVKTTTPKKNLKWSDVNEDTVGDYTFFFVCDYQ